MQSNFDEFGGLYKKVLNDFAISSANKVCSSAASQSVSDCSIIRNIAVHLIDKYYAILTQNSKYAAECSVPVRSNSERPAEKHWWTDELDEMKNRSIESHRLWVDAGRPRTGLIFDIIKNEKYSYKLAIRHAKCGAADSISNELHDALSQKDKSEFWKIWNSKFRNEGADIQNSMVSGLVDPLKISEAFGNYFCDVCKPNSEATNSRLHKKFDQKFNNYMGDELKKDDFFSVEIISKIICQLKIGKAAGLDKIETEHLLYCHPLVHVYITYLCNLMLLSGHVPSEFGIGVIFPIQKSNSGGTGHVRVPASMVEQERETRHGGEQEGGYQEILRGPTRLFEFCNRILFQGFCGAQVPYEDGRNSLPTRTSLF